MVAARLLRRALRQIGGQLGNQRDASERRLAARIVLSLAMSESELAGLDRGLVALTAVESYVVDTDDVSIAVHLHLMRGYMTVRGGRLRDGLRELDEATGLIEYAEPSAQCNILINRGYVRSLLGDLNGARLDYQRAADIAQRSGGTAEERKARHNLGEIEFFAGNLATALRIMDDAAHLEADVSSAVLLLDRAKVLLAAGLHRDADDALEQAGRLFMADRLYKDVAEVELARAECAMLDGEVALARKLAGQARDRFRRRGNDAWRRMAELTLLQADLAAGRPSGKLVPPAKRLMIEFTQTELVTQARTASLIAAEALLLGGRPDDAGRAATQIPAQRSDPISVRLYEFYIRAQLALHANDRAAARRHVRNGSNELARYQASFGSIDLQSGSAVHGRRLGELDIQMALDDGRPSALLEAVERGRARSSRLIPVESPADEQVAALLADLRRLVEEVRATEASAAPSDLAGRRERIEQVKRSLRARSWHADGSRRIARAAKSTEIQAGLAARSSALLCYVQAGDELHLVVGDEKRSLRVRRLGSFAEIVEIARRTRADLDAIAGGQLPAQLVNTIHRSLRRSLSDLDDRLVRPAQLGDQRVVVVPTGLLAVLPWGSLPSLQGRPVTVAPSGSAWLSAIAPRESTGPVSVSVFSGPALPRSDEEARAVGRLWPGSTVHTGSGARQEAFVAAIAGNSIVHVAAHGEHQTENPLFSSIRLADGPVFAYELDQNARAADHVVLSACELGQATIRPGDEALGLTSVLLHLGTRSVVAGVARVHDDVAAEVMVRYHAGLSSGVDSAQALAEACAAEVDLPTPFVCFGGDVRF